MQSAGSVDNHDIRIISLSRSNRVVCHRSRVRTHLLFHDRHAYPFAPYHNLLYSSGTESVGSAEIHFLSRSLELVGKLADCRRLAHTIHANHKDDVWTMVGREIPVVKVCRVVLFKQSHYLLLQNIVQF